MNAPRETLVRYQVIGDGNPVIKVRETVCRYRSVITYRSGDKIFDAFLIPETDEGGRPASASRRAGGTVPRAHTVEPPAELPPELDRPLGELAEALSLGRGDRMVVLFDHVDILLDGLAWLAEHRPERLAAIRSELEEAAEESRRAAVEG